MTVFISKQKKGVKQAIKRIVDSFSNELDLSKGIILKPNIVFPVKDNTGQITRLSVVKALVEVLREKKPDIDIVFGEGVAAGAIAQDNFSKSGFQRLSDELGVPLIDLDNAERIPLRWEYGTLKLPKIIFDRTYISLPILKRSSAAVFSGAMKNQKGLILPKMKKAFHKIGLHKPLAELNKVIQPSLTIMDCANFSVETLFIASNNSYEADKVAIKFLGISEPDYFKIAMTLGIGNDDFNIIGDPIGPAVLKKNFEDSTVKKFIRLKFRVSHQTCSMCRYLFQDMTNFKSGNYFLKFVFFSKLISYAFFGAEIILGSKCDTIDYSKKIICIGDCTKKFAKNNGYIHIPGCPPTIKDIAKIKYIKQSL